MTTTMQAVLTCTLALLVAWLIWRVKRIEAAFIPSEGTGE